MATTWIKRTFHGGIHPAENKHLSSLAEVRVAALPKQVVLPLSSGNGPALKPLVEVGDRVKTGQLIASCSKGFSANLHASISGQVIALEERPLVHPSGLNVASIVITSDGQDTPYQHPAYPLWQEATDEQLLEMIQQAGLVGLGGAGFPTSVKINGAYQQGIKTLIINAAECEPYITADDLLIQTQAKALLDGIAILQRLLKPQAILLGIEDNKPEALAALETALSEHPLKAALEIGVLPTRYPSGGEKQLIQLLTGQEVPSGKIPLDLGVLCHNVGTIYALNAAVTLGQPLIQRLVTVTGQAVSQPGNYWVRLGTPIQDLLDEAGIKETSSKKAQRLIVGGPMMGFTLDSSDYSITKSVNCLLLPTEKELPLPGVEQPCIRCGQCELACPAQLLPQQLYFYSANQAYEQAADQQLFDCIECGACAWVCPSEIPLVQYYRHAKAELRQMQAEAIKAEQAKQRFEARNARLEQEKLDREAKRLARAEAAARMAAAKKAAAEKEATETEASQQTSQQTSQATASKAQATQAPKAVANNTALLKQLKTAKAAASVAVRKAEKTLSNLEVNPDATPEQMNKQREMIDKAKEQLAKAEAKLAEANSLQETTQ
ncbi:electron transport complex subunit RsxC [Marinospirillum insulare]|uniref:Ion-translocating oxidoreductase complex subunit C n=1 Tax=Marinospirillum insulare TaxID=217169 RepID=A0ABQ5ZVZ1_9GAMM|nr:electron transport complex subunit RsxC [Marinospirillum insulare]GLR64345.1 hypothetical protein GCM10007878_17830 [Marinospirillum insulare]